MEWFRSGLVAPHSSVTLFVTLSVTFAVHFLSHFLSQGSLASHAHPLFEVLVEAPVVSREVAIDAVSPLVGVVDDLLVDHSPNTAYGVHVPLEVRVGRFLEAAPSEARLVCIYNGAGGRRASQRIENNISFVVARIYFSSSSKLARFASLRFASLT